MKRSVRGMTSSKYSTKSLLSLIQKQDATKGDELAQAQKQLFDLKRTIALASKGNFTLERDIRNLDKKIALLIRNRISLEQVIAESGDISLINQTTTLKDKALRQNYGKLFYLLQTDTRYIASLASIIKIAEIDNLLQTVMFTLYGNQYDEHEEHLLLSMFQQVLENEFSQAKGISGLLRANTALTRMMTTYTRRSPGQHYLKETLTPVLTNITDNTKLLLEINPLKVYELMISDYEANTGKISPLPKKVTPEEAAENKDVQNLIALRIEQLGVITDDFISALIDSLANVPYGIRWICKQIKAFMQLYFPESTRAQCCSMIGGFVLLRFINPAIVTPQAFMLVNTKLSPITRRNLTLFAKVMQNMANNVQFGGVKEFYMAPLNVVLDRNRDRLNDFLDELCNVEDLNVMGGIDKYIALGKTEKPTINISLNEMYFIHALLQQHLKEIVPQSEVQENRLKKILDDMGNAPAQLPRKENANVDLELDKSIKRDGDGTYTADQIYAETKYLLFIVMKSVSDWGSDDSNQANTIDDILEHATRYAKQHSQHSLHESVQRIRENCKLLVLEGLLDADDDYAALRRDATAELLNHENLIAKTKSDFERLTEVLSHIDKHHTFLQEQFDAYKQYLGNVREKSTCTTSVSSGKKSKKSDDSRKKSGKKEKTKKDKPKGPFKYSHSQLEKDGVIMESEVPEDRRSSIFFVFSSNSPGVFDVVVMFGRRHIAKISLQLDDLLERQHNNQLHYETDFLKLNVNLLLYILNRDFVS